MLLWRARLPAVDWLRDFQARRGIETHIQQPATQVADMQQVAVGSFDVLSTSCFIIDPLVWICLDHAGMERTQRTQALPDISATGASRTNDFATMRNRDGSKRSRPQTQACLAGLDKN